MFNLHATGATGRRGTILTAHGPIETPCFMPVGTGGAMRGITFSELESLGAQILLCNTYHLHLRPGSDLIERAGGLHSYLGWPKPIITDSGGFQVFSLKGLRKIEDHGVSFQSHIDGSPLFIGPEEAMHIQHRLGADIIMCFDECPPSTAPRADQVKAVDRTLRWAKECKNAYGRLRAKKGEREASLLFGIVQGGLERDLREKCAQELIAIGFDGYALGGLAVGETEDEMLGMLDTVCPILPKDAPRYLMGVGKIDQLRKCIARGIDIFDCVLPMREARHGRIFLSDGSVIDVLQNRYAEDMTPIDGSSPSPLSHRHNRAYLRYLLKSGERLGETIACMQNLGVTLKTVDNIRSSL